MNDDLFWITDGIFLTTIQYPDILFIFIWNKEKKHNCCYSTTISINHLAY